MGQTRRASLDKQEKTARAKIIKISILDITRWLRAYQEGETEANHKAVKRPLRHSPEVSEEALEEFQMNPHRRFSLFHGNSH